MNWVGLWKAFPIATVPIWACAVHSSVRKNMTVAAMTKLLLPNVAMMIFSIRFLRMQSKVQGADVK